MNVVWYGYSKTSPTEGLKEWVAVGDDVGPDDADDWATVIPDDGIAEGPDDGETVRPDDGLAVGLEDGVVVKASLY